MSQSRKSPEPGDTPDRWPSLPYAEWQDTCATLHMWTQIVGKIRLSYAPRENHFWHAALHVTPRGLTTSPIPAGSRTFAVTFDFVNHCLDIDTSDGICRTMALYPRSVADFYAELISVLRTIGLEISIFLTPQEVPDPIPFDEDTIHASYEQNAVERFRQILVQTDRIFKEFRGRFIGKSSPVIFWWGSFDLAVTRFSGRRAPERPGADYITREAYSHECSSVGFWPGNGGFGKPAFYAYTAPPPEGYGEGRVRPTAAYYDSILGEFLLPYDDVRASRAPESDLLAFLQSAYELGANLGGWDRENLERRGEAAG